MGKQDPTASGMTIGQLAQATGCPIETIRYYERIELLPQPARSAGNYRLYRETHVQRLRFIRHCRLLDLNLEGIRQLLTFRDSPEENCCEVDELLDDHIAHVVHRIEELKALETSLRHLRGLCKEARTAKECRILQSLSTDPGRCLPGWSQ